MQLLEQKRTVDLEAVLLARVYALILSWGEPTQEEKPCATQSTRAASVGANVVPTKNTTQGVRP